jgi:hypothetical protein
MPSEEAKAVSEVAKTTGKALEIVQGTGGWLGSVLGRLPEDLIGLAGADWVHEKRRRTIAQMQAQTAEFIAVLAPDRLIEPSPSVVLPLLQSAANRPGQSCRDRPDPLGCCNREFGMKWRVMLELVGPDGTVVVHEVGVTTRAVPRFTRSWTNREYQTCEGDSGPPWTRGHSWRPLQAGRKVAPRTCAPPSRPSARQLHDARRTNRGAGTQAGAESPRRIPRRQAPLRLCGWRGPSVGAEAAGTDGPSADACLAQRGTFIPQDRRVGVRRGHADQSRWRQGGPGRR